MTTFLKDAVYGGAEVTARLFVHDDGNYDVAYRFFSSDHFSDAVIAKAKSELGDAVSKVVEGKKLNDEIPNVFIAQKCDCGDCESVILVHAQTYTI